MTLLGICTYCGNEYGYRSANPGLCKACRADVAACKVCAAVPGNRRGTARAYHHEKQGRWPYDPTIESWLRTAREKIRA